MCINLGFKLKYFYTYQSCLYTTVTAHRQAAWLFKNVIIHKVPDKLTITKEFNTV